MASNEFDLSVFKKMSTAQLKETQKKLLNLRKQRRKQYVKPIHNQHVKPVHDQYIKPLLNQHISPINSALREITKYLPEEKKMWQIGDKRYGPMTKKELLNLIKIVR